MKKFFIVLLLTMIVGINTYGQKKERQHTGFFLSMGIGGVGGPIHMKSNVDGEYDMSGIGGVFDFKIGGAVKENLILHATLLSNSLVGPKISGATGNIKTSNQLTVGEAMFGGGATYYFTPSNMFIRFLRLR